jgi:segregation and condensation protein B
MAKSNTSRTGVTRIDADESQAISSIDEALSVTDEAVSFEELSAAYAKLLADREPPSQDSVDALRVASEPLRSGEKIAEDSDEAESIAEEDDHEAGVVSPRGIVEAVLFVGDVENRPITAEFLAGIMRDVSAEDIHEWIDELNRLYLETRRAVRIVESGGGYRLEVCDDLEGFKNNIAAKFRETQLNQNALDCLAIVAYQPGSTCDEVERLWGRPATHVLSLLVRRELLRVERERHGSDKGSKTRYFPTDRFLNLVGMASLDDLPRVEDDGP